MSQEQIIIVGGGIMGVCTAYYLSRTPEFVEGKIAVKLVEEGEIAGGASGQAAGFCAKDWHPAATTPLSALSFDLHASLAREYDGARRWGYRPVKAYSVDIKPPSRRRRRSAMAEEATASEIAPPTRELPHQAHWLDIPSGQDQQVGEALNWLDPEAVDEMQLLGDDGTTAQLHPGDFTRAMWAEAERAGVQRVKGRVVSVTKSADGSVESLTVKTSADDGQQSLPLHRLLIAAGPWSGTLSRQLGITDIPVHDLPGHSIIYRPPRPLAAECLFSRILDKDATTGPELFTRSDGTLYVAGQNTGGPLPPDGPAHVQLQESELGKLRKAMAILSPQLNDGQIVKTQLCYRPVTKRGTPYLSRVPGNDNVWCCAGSGPWGITQGPGCGLVMSEMLLGKSTSADVSQLAL